MLLGFVLPGAGIESEQDLVDFLTDQGIATTIDADGDLQIADEDLVAATNALASVVGNSSGAVIELNAGG